MASKGLVEQYLNALPTESRYPLQKAFDEVLDNWRFGTAARAQNAQLYFLTGTTAAVANTEISIAHGLSAAPKWILPILDAQTVGAQLVPLKTTRVADASRIYLSSSSTSAPFTVLVEV
jgi:hypothetical protein